LRLRRKAKGQRLCTTESTEDTEEDQVNVKKKLKVIYRRGQEKQQHWLRLRRKAKGQGPRAKNHTPQRSQRKIELMLRKNQSDLTTEDTEKSNVKCSYAGRDKSSG
jgi:hypothetical protein